MVHCPECEVCIDGHDHHCGYFNKCIGGYQKFAFFGALSFGFLGFVTILVLFSYNFIWYLNIDLFVKNNLLINLK